MNNVRVKIVQSQLNKMLCCVECKKGCLEENANRLVCTSCGESYPFRNTSPILLRKTNELFPQSQYELCGDTASSSAKPTRRSIWDWLPTRSINVCRPTNLKQIAADIKCGEVVQILVIGSGSQAIEILKYFDPQMTRFVFCDITTSGDVDVFCDAHELPFADGSFDGLITTAVMEHVLYPEVVAKEIARVVRIDGFVYSEIPFLQAVHMGAYDFTRFTLSGHRRLYEDFSEVKSGMVAGAGTALIWSLQGFVRSIFRNRKLAKLGALCVRIGFFWLKYFDLLFQHNQRAADFASATFYYGRRSKTKESGSEIINRY